MFQTLIPSAKAQGFVNTASNAANTGKDVAVEGAQTGIQALVNYVVSNIGNWIGGVVIFIIFYILGKMGASAAKRAIIKKQEDVQESALILVERITFIVILTIGVTIAFAINGLNFTAVIGAMSLGIGFALKDIIGNFISGVIMLSQNRINIGDFIKVKDILGTIVNIDTRATVLQAIDGTEVVIPNQTMLGETLISYTTNPFRRIDLNVGVDYKTDLPMVTSLIKGIIDKDDQIVVKPEPLVLVDEFGDSSIIIKIRFWVESHIDWQNTRSNLANKIKKAFDELGINIPFPIRTLKLDEDDRAVLKTLDSFKKGFVPEPTSTPSQTEVADIANKTKSFTNIPEELFKVNEREGQVSQQENMQPPKEAKESVVKNDNNQAPSLNQASPVQQVAPEVQSAPAAAKTPPPTHL